MPDDLANARIRRAILGDTPVVGAKRNDELEQGAVHLMVNGAEIDIPAKAWCAMVAEVSDGGTNRTSLAVATMLHAGRPDLLVSFDGENIARVVLKAVEDMIDDDGNLVDRKVHDMPPPPSGPPA
jgi:hypothetical protein